MSDETTQTDAADEYAAAEAHISFLEQKFKHARAYNLDVVMHDTSAAEIWAELRRLVRELKRCSTAYAEACAGLHRVRVERDAARAELARLREACAGAPDMLVEMADELDTEYSSWHPEKRAKAAAIRAALGEDGTP